MEISKVKEPLDTANAAIKLLEPFLERAEKWRLGQRLVAGIALIAVASTLALGVADPRYIAAAVFLVMGMSFLTRKPTWIVARHVAVRDEKGALRAVLTTEGGQPTFTALDQSGEVRLRCGLGLDGTPSVTLIDSGGLPRALLGSDPVTGPAFAMTDALGRLRLQLALSREDGNGMLALLSEEGHPALLAYEANGQAAIAGRDAAGTIAWTIPIERSV